MRKSLATMFCLLLASCSHLPRGGTGSNDVHDSVYKVRVTLTVDTSSLYEDKEEGGEEGESKQLTVYRPIAVDDIVKLGDHSASVAWSGTAWVAAKAPGRSFLMTAGHVCESGDMYHLQMVDWAHMRIISADLPIIKKEHTLISSDGVEIEANVVRDEDLKDDYSGNDLCMLGAAGDLGPAIPVSKEDPQAGEICDVVGAPRGLWGNGIAVASDAKFSGRGSVFGIEPDGLAFNGNMAPGNSGSAVTCEGKAVGVISLASTQFSSLIHAVPYERIREFMMKALHRTWI